MVIIENDKRKPKKNMLYTNNRKLSLKIPYKMHKLNEKAYNTEQKAKNIIYLLILSALL